VAMAAGTCWTRRSRGAMAQAQRRVLAVILIVECRDRVTLYLAKQGLDVLNQLLLHRLRLLIFRLEVHQDLAVRLLVAVFVERTSRMGIHSEDTRHRRSSTRRDAEWRWRRRRRLVFGLFPAANWFHDLHLFELVVNHHRRVRHHVHQFGVFLGQQIVAVRG